MKNLITLLILTLSIQSLATETNIDQELNTNYQNALKISHKPELLKKSQRTWLNFINQDCEHFVYGIDTPQGHDPAHRNANIENCLIEHKTQRNNYLKQIINDYQ